MKRAGEWHSIDLNENLVDGMLDGTVSRFVILHQEICSSDLSEIEVYGTIFSRFFWNQNWSCSSWYGSWLGRICHLFTGFQAIRASCDVTIQSISMHVFYHWEDVDLHCFQGTERNANRRQNARHKLKDCAMTYVRWICWNLHEGIIYWVSAACKGKAFVVFHWLYTQLVRYREFGGSFKELLRNQLEAHYHDVARQSGAGMFQRMKVGAIILTPYEEC